MTRQSMRALLPMAFILVSASCSRVNDVWVLKSYDKDKGYTFTKGGVDYQATCFATGYPVLGRTNNSAPDLNPDAMPPDIAHSESDCDDVMPYLHKPVPNLRQPYGSLLLFTEKNNYRLEFEVKQAK